MKQLAFLEGVFRLGCSIFHFTFLLYFLVVPLDGYLEFLIVHDSLCMVLRVAESY